MDSSNYETIYGALDHMSIEELRREWLSWQQRSYLNPKKFRSEFDAAWKRFKPQNIKDSREEALAMTALAADLVLYWEALEESRG